MRIGAGLCHVVSFEDPEQLMHCLFVCVFLSLKCVVPLFFFKIEYLTVTVSENFNF